MSENIGNTDRLIRLLIAAICALLFYTGIAVGTLGRILMTLCLFLIATASIGSCPLYQLFGFSTYTLDPENKKRLH